MTQQEEGRLNNKPTSGISGFSNAMIDSIVNDKIQSFINQMGPFYNSPYEVESVNDKKCSHNISIVTSSNAVTMEIIEQMLPKILQDNNSKSDGRNNNKAPFFRKGMI